MLSILQNKSEIIFKNKPFPYIIIDNALPLDLYNELNNNYPDYKKIIGNLNYKPNYAYRYNAINSLNDDDISTQWKNFIRYHLSYKFLEEIYLIFNESIEKFYPNSKSKLPNRNNISIRGEKKTYFQLDCQFVINTPTIKKSSVITPHLDSPSKFFAALLYMKNTEDKSTGGNFTINSYGENINFIEKTRLLKECVVYEEIEYKSNRLVMFLNTPLSLHGVTERDSPKHFRKYINFVGQFNNDLFDYKKLETNVNR